jgi:hypothetical protein
VTGEQAKKGAPLSQGLQFIYIPFCKSIASPCFSSQILLDNQKLLSYTPLRRK